MEAPKEPFRKRFIRKLRTKFRFVIVNDETFEENWSLRLSPMNIFIWAGSGALLIITATTLLIAYTPLREFIPGYPDGSLDQELINNRLRVESLEKKLEANENYMARLKILLSGEAINDSIPKPELKKADKNVKFTKSEKELEFRKKMEEKEKYEVSFDTEESNATAGAVMYGMYLFVPVDGEITSSFSAAKDHYGIDIAAAKNEAVKSAMDGTVVFSDWTTDGGHEIHVQHQNNVVTIYKHNSYLMKRTGDRVKAGEAIAIVGNTGKLSEGIHLHFEIWHNGIPVDPEKYIVF